MPEKKKKEDIESKYRDWSESGKMVELGEDESFISLLDKVTVIIGRLLDQHNAETIGYLYDGLGFSEDMILYLYDYCASQNKARGNYVKAIAESWKKAGVKTRWEAEKYMEEPKHKSGSRSEAARAKLGTANDPHTDYDALVMAELLEELGVDDEEDSVK